MPTLRYPCSLLTDRHGWAWCGSRVGGYIGYGNRSEPRDRLSWSPAIAIMPDWSLAVASGAFDRLRAVCIRWGDLNLVPRVGDDPAAQGTIAGKEKPRPALGLTGASMACPARRGVSSPRTSICAVGACGGQLLPALALRIVVACCFDAAHGPNTRDEDDGLRRTVAWRCRRPCAAPHCV